MVFNFSYISVKSDDGVYHKQPKKTRKSRSGNVGEG